MGSDLFEDKSDDYIIRDIINYDGNGVSIMGMIINVGGISKLYRRDMQRYSGKDWGDSQCLQPRATIQPCCSTPFFHAKRDSSATGCCGAVCYEFTTSKV